MPGFSGVGLVTIYDRLVTGLQGLGTFVGNCPSLQVKLQENVVERNESTTTTRSPNRRMTKATNASLELVTDEFNKTNFARATKARIDSVAASGSTLNFTFPDSAAVGNTLALPDKNVSSVVVTDSTGTPKTLAVGQYELDAFAGTIKLLDITTGGPYVQPFKGAYSRGAVSVLSGLVTPATEVWVGMSGVNVDTGEKGVLDIYRVRFSVADVLDFINEDYQDYKLTGTVLIDTTKTSSAVGGQNFKFTLPTTVA